MEDILWRKYLEAKEFLEKLDFKTGDFTISNLIYLYNILNDPEKVKEIFTKLNNKAFW